MHLRIVLLWVVVVALCANGQTTLPQPGGVRQLAGHFWPGMTHAEVDAVVRAHALQQGSRPGHVDQDNILYERLGPSEGTYIVLTYARAEDPNDISPDLPVTKVEFTRFDELRDSIPPDLYPYVKQVHDAPLLESYPATFSPTDLIRAVNALQPLGKERALAVLRAYEELANDEILALEQEPQPDWMRATSGSAALQRFRYGIDEDRVFLVARLLFQHEGGNREMPSIGSSRPLGQRQFRRADWPVFPLAVECDMPFLLPFDWTIAGQRQVPEEHLRYYEKNCVVRDRPLHPTVSPVTAAEAIMSSPRWRALYVDRYGQTEATRVLRLQAMRALRPLADRWLGKWEASERVTRGSDADRDWQECVQDRQVRSMSWSGTKQEFVTAKAEGK